VNQQTILQSRGKRLLQRNPPHESGAINATIGNINGLMAFRTQATALLDNLRISELLDHQLRPHILFSDRLHEQRRLRLQRQNSAFVTRTLVSHTTSAATKQLIRPAGIEPLMALRTHTLANRLQRRTRIMVAIVMVTAQATSASHVMATRDHAHAVVHLKAG